MTIKLVYSASLNNVIKVDNVNPWLLDEDIKRFKNFADNAIIITDPQTWSVNSDMEGRLGKFISVIISKTFECHTALVFSSVKDALTTLTESYPGVNFVITGNTEILQEGLLYADEIELTRILTSCRDGELMYGPVTNHKDWIADYTTEIACSFEGLRYQFVRYLKSNAENRT